MLLLLLFPLIAVVIIFLFALALYLNPIGGDGARTYGIFVASLSFSAIEVEVVPLTKGIGCCKARKLLFYRGQEILIYP